MGEEELVSRLRDHGLRVTPQRRAILRAFTTPDEHLTAEEVHARASAAVRGVGRGTVYSTLAELAELGLLSAVGQQDPIRYETTAAPHDHFRCRLCQRLFNVELGGQEIRRRELDSFRIEQAQVEARGVCAECTDYDRGLRDGAARVLSEESTQIEAVAGAMLESPLGNLALVASAEGIVRIAFSDHADFERLDELVKRRRGPRAARPRLSALMQSIDSYFQGSGASATDVVDWGSLEPELDTSLNAIREIAFGQSRSYDRLDGCVSPYSCGLAIGSNPVPLLIPCHRVCRGSEPLDAYVGGTDRLRLLQELEAEPPTSAGADHGSS